VANHSPYQNGKNTLQCHETNALFTAGSYKGLVTSFVLQENEESDRAWTLLSKITPHILANQALYFKRN
jgi:hypothetical protein